MICCKFRHANPGTQPNAVSEHNDITHDDVFKTARPLVDIWPTAHSLVGMNFDSRTGGKETPG